MSYERGPISPASSEVDGSVGTGQESDMLAYKRGRTQVSNLSGSRRYIRSPFCLQRRVAFCPSCWSPIFIPQGTRLWHKSQVPRAGASVGGHLHVSGEEKCPPGGRAWVLCGALAVRVELWAAAGFWWAFQQRGLCPLGGGGTSPSTLSGRRELTDGGHGGIPWGGYLSCP